MAETEISFSLHGNFNSSDRKFPEGNYTARISEKKIIIENDTDEIITSFEAEFQPESDTCLFELKNVTIGINFHWKQKDNQRFRGGLRLVEEGGKIRCINIVPLEEYLKSVISSEMSAHASSEFLKAHAVISRSWLLFQIGKSKKPKNRKTAFQTRTETENEVTRWYSREDHPGFDVCADDHCQRYHGITKIITEKAVTAVNRTSGEILVSDGRICDTRFSKCCGGITENFENVWEPVPHSYLSKVVDSETGVTPYNDLRKEDQAEKWIKSQPPAFCNTSDIKILSQVLPDSDQATTDFFRWKVEYSQQQLSEIIKKRSGSDFGEIIKMETVERGHSGRIVKLKITGTKKSLTIGKELEIRKWLSESHLYSSAFVIDHQDLKEGIPQKFVLTGAGWGHGVGLCQIGAAVMGENGYSYRQILEHYFKGTEIVNWYD